VLRQDPDVLMIGEMRDRESIATAMTAAETGHLVFQRFTRTRGRRRLTASWIRSRRSSRTRPLLSLRRLGRHHFQRLVPKVDGGRVPACELMLANPAIKNLIREKKFFQIDW
jgi:twitching motility protein PilT